MATNISAAFALVGVFCSTAPPGSRWADGRMRSRHIIGEITAVPGLAIGLKAKDLRERYEICLSTAYQVLRRARRIQAMQTTAGAADGQVAR